MTPETVRRFTIKWNGSEYKLSIYGYDGGEVVDAKSYDLLHAQAVALATALARLSNETLGSLPLEEAVIRHAIGNTNYSCLIQRAEEGRALLNQAQALLEGT